MKLTIYLILILTINISPLMTYEGFYGDYLFRTENDWNAVNYDGSQTKARHRLRYRFRFGYNADFDALNLGFRLRTGEADDPQGQPTTFGKYANFGLHNFVMDKLYLNYKYKNFKIELGKNVIPLSFHHDLFWSGNIYPSGASLQYEMTKYFRLFGAHYIAKDANTHLNADSYIQLLASEYKKENMWLSASLFRFANHTYFSNENINDIRDQINPDWWISRVSTKYTFAFLNTSFGLDYWHNLETKDLGLASTIKYIGFQDLYGLYFQLILAYIEKDAFYDYYTQNDWSRWTHPNSPVSTLTNMQGIELSSGVKINDHLKLVSKYYYAERIQEFDYPNRSNHRWRFDIVGMF